MSSLSVTILTGFANSGKTSVLLGLLRKKKEHKHTAVLMNDIAEVVSRAGDVRDVMGSARHQVLELPNGCICCTLKDVFLQTVEKIAVSSVSHLYIEGNAAADPFLIQSFLEESEVADSVHIENMTTVIDASQFFRDFVSTDTLSDRGLVALPHDDRIVSEVLADQIEYADTLIITKCDLVSEADRTFLAAALAKLNPEASVVYEGREEECVHEEVFDVWNFTAERPFHPGRLHAAMQGNGFQSVLRARGTAWLATRNAYKVRWSQTGSICSLEADGSWWTPGSSDEEEKLNAEWFEACSNRHQDLEFIGTHGSFVQLKKLLDSCLLTDIELALGADLWQYFDDPFKQWDHDMDRSLFVVRECFAFSK